MTLASEVTKVQYDGNGSTTAFPVTFIFFDNSDLKVIQTVDATGVETVLVETTNFTLTGGNGAVGDLTALVAPPSGETLTIKSDLDDIQETKLPLGGKFPSTTVERQMDILTRLIQQKQEELSRAVVLAESSKITGIELPVPTANKALLWNAAGDNLTNSANDFDDIVIDALAAQVAAETAQTAAELAETNAETAETNAETAEVNAETAETNAETAETNAAASAAAAAISAANPSIWTANPQSGDYTVLLTDKYKVIEVTTGAINRTITLLPAATATDGFRIVIKKVDSGIGEVIIDGDGAELIDGALTQTLSNENDFLDLATDAVDWEIVGIFGGNAIDFTTQETPSGTINGVNDTFTLANIPQLNSEMVYLDNIRMQRGEDYTISGLTITMLQIPLTGEILEVDYFKTATILNSVDLSSPPPIGDSTPNTGDFTTLGSTGNAVVGGDLTVTGSINGAAFGNELLHVQDQKADGVHGGGFTSGAERTRDLNTVLTNEITGASLAANQITLPAGTYFIQAGSEAYGGTSGHRILLRDVTDSSDILVGSICQTVTGTNSRSELAGRFTLSIESDLEIHHRCEVTKATDGLGRASQWGDGKIEVYTDVQIRRVG